MKIGDKKFFKKTDVLKSGDYYAVKANYTCYRINEPDHYLKNIDTIFFGYFNKEEQFQHFNRQESQRPATTSLTEIFSLQGLNSIEFYHLTTEGLNSIGNPSFPKTFEESKIGYIAETLVNKTLEAFKNCAKEDSGVVFRVEDIMRKHKKEYLTPPDLPN